MKSSSIIDQHVPGAAAHQGISGKMSDQQEAADVFSGLEFGVNKHKKRDLKI